MDSYCHGDCGWLVRTGFPVPVVVYYTHLRYITLLFFTVSWFGWFSGLDWMDYSV